METEIKVRLKEFIAKFAKLGGPEEVPDTEDLFALGYLNSLGLISLLVFIQEDLGCAVSDGIEDYEDMTSVESIYRHFFVKA